MRGNKNDKRIKLFPETSKVNEEIVSETAVITAQQKFMEMVHAYKHEGLPKHVQKEETACDSSSPQRDPRGDYAKINLIKNKLRSGLGVKNPIVMVSNEDDVKEGAGISVGISKAVGNLLSNPKTSSEQGAKNFQKNVADPVGNAVKGAARAVVQPANMSPEAQKARRDKYRPEEVELEGEIIDETHLGVKASLISMRSKTERSGMDKLARTQNSDDADLGRQKSKKIRAQQANQEKNRKSNGEEDDDDHNNHPSLDARGRNPSMR